MRRLTPAALLLASLLAAGPALAADTGSLAWLIRGQWLYSGPDRLVVVGQLGDATRIRVDRCTARVCQVHGQGQAGWVARRNVSFGRYPWRPFWGLLPN